MNISLKLKRSFENAKMEEGDCYQVTRVDQSLRVEGEVYEWVN